MPPGTYVEVEVSVPFRVANFEVVAEVGRGGMGIVYRAHDLNLRRDVAMKRPRPDLLDRPGFRQRFLAEGRAASTLLHPHVSTVFEALEHDSIPWLVMELVDGISLRRLLQRGNPLRLEDILQHAEGLADALRAAHARHLLHRDVNPNNVLIGTDGRARLTDFGLACAWVEEPAEPSATTASDVANAVGRVVGTRGYLSPEQALGRPLDPRSDLFSLGLVMYEMTTGRRAFPATESGVWLDALLHHEPAAVCDFNRDAPPELGRIIRRATAKEPVQRYQSASEMLLDIRALRHKLESDAGDTVVPVGRARPVRPWLLAVAGVTAAAVAAVGLWRAIDAGRDRAPFAGWTPRQLTTAPGWEAEPAISPDGSLIAYASDQAGNPDIWLIDVRGGESLRLTTGPAADTSPAWFPDGSAVAFERANGAQSSIWKVPRLGGAPTMLVEDGAQPTISLEGGWVAFTRADASGEQHVMVMSLTGAADIRFVTTTDDGLFDHRHPAWSPDGEWICYADFRDLWLVPAAGGASTRLTRDQAVDDSPVWSADGRWIYFSSLRGATTAVWRVHSSGGTPERVTSGSGPERQPSVSRDGTRLAYSTFVSDPDALLVDRSTGARSLISGSRQEDTPAVAPDGRSVVYTSDRLGKFDLWRQPVLDGRVEGSPQKLTDHPGNVACPRFSPDGQWIAYFRVEGSARTLWILPAAGGIPHRLVERSGIDMHASFSPAGDRIAFVSDRSGHESVWISGFADGRLLGQPREVAVDGAQPRFPAWSGDAREIAFVWADDVWVVGEHAGGPARKLTSGAGIQFVDWDPWSQGWLAMGFWGGQRLEVRRLDPVTGRDTALDPPVSLGGVHAASTGGLDRSGRLLACVLNEVRGDIWVLERN
jgi:Tol biopolymer transport system component/tRNA A-37 threonylcarbamoyl transferase component Bud32